MASDKEAIRKWIDASTRDAQPEATLAIFVSVRDGQVTLATPFDMKRFPYDDLSVAQRLIDAEFAKTIAKGPSDE